MININYTTLCVCVVADGVYFCLTGGCNISEDASGAAQYGL